MVANFFEFAAVGSIGGFCEENRPFGLAPKGFCIGLAFAFDKQQAEAFVTGELAKEDIQLDRIVSELDPGTRGKAGGGVDAG